MRYLLILAVLGLGGCASVQTKPDQSDLETAREKGLLQPIPPDAPTFERGF